MVLLVVDRDLEPGIPQRCGALVIHRHLEPAVRRDRNDAVGIFDAEVPLNAAVSAAVPAFPIGTNWAAWNAAMYSATTSRAAPPATIRPLSRR